MAVDTFIPEVWNAELLVALRKSLVFGQGNVSNRDYEGDIAAYGDTVHINSLTSPTVANYVKNTTVINPATLTTVDDTLLINQAKYFAFEVDDVDMRQTRDGGQLLTKAASDSAHALADAADVFLAGLMTADAGNTLPAEAITTADGAYMVVIKLRLALDKAKVPSDRRFLTVSPDFYAMLLQDPRFIDASQYGTNAPIMNGEVGRVLGFTVLVSLNLPEGTAGVDPAVSNYVVAGHPMATTFAEQINKTEAYRPESSFSDAIKGLHLYGGKVVRPEALAVADVDVTVDAP